MGDVSEALIKGGNLFSVFLFAYKIERFQP